MRPVHRFRLACAPILVAIFALPAAAHDTPAEGTPSDDAELPIVTFFYYDAAGVEWAVSAEPGRFQRHLASNADSQQLFEQVNLAMADSAATNNSAAQMTRWIENERQRFDQSRREPTRMRMAEGIVAYLRTHDFSIPNLVRALKRRSGASAVELVVIHLRDARGESSFKLKVVLVDPEIEIGKQGFNVNLPSPNASYTLVTYALGVALYEVQEIIHGDSSGDDAKENESIEPLPVPEPVVRPAPEGVPARLRTPSSN